MTMEGSPQETAVVVHRGKSVPVGRLPERSVLSLSELSACLTSYRRSCPRRSACAKEARHSTSAESVKNSCLGFVMGMDLLSGIESSIITQKYKNQSEL